MKILPSIIVARQLIVDADVTMYWRCKFCGCNDNDCSQCIAKTGSACHWIFEDVCSGCASAEELTIRAIIDSVVTGKPLVPLTP